MSQDNFSKEKYIHSLIIKSGTVPISNIYKILDDRIEIYTDENISFGSYHVLGFLDKFLRFVWNDIPFLDYKLFYMQCVISTANYSPSTMTNIILTESYNFVYTAYYAKIFDSLCDLGHRETKKMALLI